MKGRYFRPRAKGLPKGYDSFTEFRIHQELPSIEFHPERYEYTIDRKYQPDFLFTAEGTVYVVEVKGYLQDSAEAQKYKWISKALPPDHELIFVFEKPDKPLHFRSIRADGTKQTCEQWATKQGFRCFDETSFKTFVESFNK